MFRRVLLLTLGAAMLLTVLGLPTATPAPAASMTFTVNTTDTLDDGACDATHCSLIEAWKASEPQFGGNPGKDTIAFNIPGPAPHTISVGRLDFTDPEGIVIDGRTQGGPGYTGPPLIVIDGTGSFSDQLVITGGGSEIHGLVIHGGTFAIAFANNPGENVVEGNFIGTDVTGMTPVPTAGGVFATNGAGSNNNRIGGTTPAARNVIVASRGTAVQLEGSGNVVEGNSSGLTRPEPRPSATAASSSSETTPRSGGPRGRRPEGRARGPAT